MIRGQACSQDKPFKILGTSHLLERAFFTCSLMQRCSWLNLVLCRTKKSAHVVFLGRGGERERGGEGGGGGGSPGFIVGKPRGYSLVHFFLKINKKNEIMSNHWMLDPSSDSCSSMVCHRCGEGVPPWACVWRWVRNADDSIELCAFHHFCWVRWRMRAYELGGA
jgi:hypothetical protein